MLRPATILFKASNISVLSSFVYAKCTKVERRDLWSYLSDSFVLYKGHQPIWYIPSLEKDLSKPLALRELTICTWLNKEYLFPSKKGKLLTPIRYVQAFKEQILGLATHWLSHSFY